MSRPSLLLVACLLFSVVAPSAQALSLDVSDLDGDGLANLQEDKNDNGKVDAGETDFLKADTDGGGESDGSEVKFGRNPLDGTDDLTADPDSDGLPNGLEIQRGTDQKSADTDGDGAKDDTDPFPLERAFKTDADHDGIADEWETAHNFNAKSAVDAELDADSDGVTNRDEFIADTDPRNPDTDRDGTPDGAELTAGTDPDESLCLSFSESAVTPFGDTGEHWAQSQIALLSGLRIAASQQAIIGGYGSGGVRVYLPDRNVTRLEFLKMALLSSCVALEEAKIGTTLPFTDMAMPLSHDADVDALLRQRLIQTGMLHNIIRGYPDNTFRPDAPVTRAEAVKMLLQASRVDSLNASGTGSTAFSDVPATAWFQTVVQQAAALGIVKGYDTGDFRPEQPITRAEAAVIILRAIRVNPSVNGEVLPLM